jgi:hypothetical protein
MGRVFAALQAPSAGPLTPNMLQTKHKVNRNLWEVDVEVCLNYEKTKAGRHVANRPD